MVKRMTALLALLLVLSGCSGGAAVQPTVADPQTGTTGPTVVTVTDPITEEEVGTTTATVTDPTTGDPVDPTTEGVDAPVTQETEPSTEVTEPVAEPEDEDLVRVLDYIPGVKQALPYATTENFTGTVIYDFTDAYLRYGTVKKLLAVSKDLQQYGYGLLIWDGYRPLSAQQKLYDVCPDPNYVSPPGVGAQNHCRGKAVDLTLIDLASGVALEMPTGFDEFSPLADRDYSDATAMAMFHALLLEQTMERHGFQGYSGEWWHFNDTDEYPIEEHFDPAEVG